MAVEERFKEIESGFELELVEGEEKVASLGVGRYTMRLAGAEVLMGGIWGVVTHPAHRGRGLGAQMLRATVGRLRAERFPISLLWGISDFYHRFGYVPVLPSYTLTVTTRNAERLGDGSGSGVTVRPGTPADTPALAELYHRVTASRTGTLRRWPAKCRSAFDPTPPRETDNWWRHTRRILVVDRGGPPLGYALLHGNPAQLSVVEVVVQEEHVETAGVALLAALTREAVERREAEIKISLPPDDPLAQLLRRAGCKAEVSYPANGGGMGRIVDLPALADAIVPGLTARAAALPAELRPGALELICSAQGEEPEQRATIDLGAGGERVVRLGLPQQRLCQLLMGYQGIDALRRERPEACAAEDAPLIRALLPEGYPHMWSIDHF